MNTKRLVTLSLFLSMSIVLSIVESFIPSMSIPGAKLGLANIMTLVILSIYGEKDAFAIVILRIFLVGLLRGSIGAPAFFLSLSGGLLAYSMMVLFQKLRVFSIVGVSVMGSLGHSLGQILMAMVILSLPELVYHFPLLFLIAIPTGVFTGLVAKKFTEISKNIIIT
ncbi:MAG: Gx transporter family protein [Candidatus Izimaplasma sp.]|nr:Gx transporter family protein [Candidatus Izimaplasma bacterium]